MNDEQESSDLVPVALIPINVFGVDEEEGYGLMDSVGSWSDCNRADGKMYRAVYLARDLAHTQTYFEENEHQIVYVPRDRLYWFLINFNEGDSLEERAQRAKEQLA